MSKGLVGLMNSSSQLHYISNREIDLEKWNSCIRSANSNHIYASSWYLDRVAPDWKALIWGDYEYVFPIIWKKKMGIKYLFQPPYCQQLGFFSNPPTDIQEQFSKFIRKNFKYVNIQTNRNIDRNAFKDFSIKERLNLVLPLFGHYDEIYNNFNKHAKRNINKAKKNEIRVVEGINPQEYLLAKLEASKHKNIPPNISILKKIIPASILDSNGVIFGAYSKQNELCGAAYLIRSSKRIIYLNAFSTSFGREKSAMYLIVNEIIKRYSNTMLTLDFEGSEVDGVARFYRGFGALDEFYYHLKYNNLPFLLRLFKK